MYHYLTGAASWYMMTMITQVFGVRGEAGDLLLEPKLTAGQFDAGGHAAVQVTFAGRRLTVCYQNPAGWTMAATGSGPRLCDGTELCAGSSGSSFDPRAMVERACRQPNTGITVTLCWKTGRQGTDTSNKGSNL